SGPSPPQTRSPWTHTSRFKGLAPRAASGTYTAVVEPPFRLLNEHSLPFVAASGAQTAASPRLYCGGHCADLLLVRRYINGLLIRPGKLSLRAGFLRDDNDSSRTPARRFQRQSVMRAANDEARVHQPAPHFVKRVNALAVDFHGG